MSKKAATPAKAKAENKAESTAESTAVNKAKVTTRSIAKGTQFEDALQELELLVEKLESGEHSLEESLVQFERGMLLSKFCQQSLTDAEKKIKILAADNSAEDSETLSDDLQDFER